MEVRERGYMRASQTGANGSNKVKEIAMDDDD
jgi:hypothetical protein